MLNKQVHYFFKKFVFWALLHNCTPGLCFWSNTVLFCRILFFLGTWGLYNKIRVKSYKMKLGQYSPSPCVIKKIWKGVFQRVDVICSAIRLKFKVVRETGNYNFQLLGTYIPCKGAQRLKLPQMLWDGIEHTKPVTSQSKGAVTRTPNYIRFIMAPQDRTTR